ncbi:MAG: hypothetical protein GVY18_11250 [Bacteroidetes bacterium]|jgi:hypothetical protein|nr:hypothetical protein [Bacteroidota bacterium]
MRTPLLILAGLLLLPAPSRAQGNDVKSQRPYDSRYLVFGTRDADDTPRWVVLDFNRTEREPDRVTYEYKVFTARGGDWTLHRYEQWDADPTGAPRFPARRGVRPTLASSERMDVAVDLPDLRLRVTMAPPAFSFVAEKEALGTIRTAHVPVTVEWDGTTYRGTGVYEWVIYDQSPARANAEEAAEAQRQLDDEAFFGLYDWIVLYDAQGRLWQVSQGTLTEDFAYQGVTSTLPGVTHDVLVRWLATAYDATARQHSPTDWLVDVPDWGMRVRLTRQGEHRGHGPPQRDGTRPAYALVSTTGEGIVEDTRQPVMALVELIQD